MESARKRHPLSNNRNLYMKKNKKLGYAFILLISFALLPFLPACSNNIDHTSANETILESEIALSEPVPSKVETTERKLVKEGTIAFETDDLAETGKHIKEVIKQYEAYIASENEYKYIERQTRTLTVRVEARRFDAFINDITQGIERFDTKDIRTRDITEEFVDIQARLKTKKELEQRYLVLLQKANKVSEILEIEQQIGKLREDIESTEGRLRFLDNQSSYSTLSISYYKSIPQRVAFGREFVQGFSAGWQHFVWFILGLVNTWPFIVLVVLFVFFLRHWWKRRKGA